MQVGVLGFMAIWGVHLDAISMINLIMCIGSVKKQHQQQQQQQQNKIKKYFFMFLRLLVGWDN